MVWRKASLSEALKLLKKISNLTTLTVFGITHFAIEVLEIILIFPGEPLHLFIEDLLKPCRDMLRFIVTLYQEELRQISPTNWRVILFFVLNHLENFTERLNTWKERWEHVEGWGYVPDW